MRIQNFQKLLRRAAALLLALCVMAGSSTAIDYTAANVYSNVIAFEATPDFIDNGAVDPTIYLYLYIIESGIGSTLSSSKSASELIDSIKVDTGTTGLTMIGIDVIEASETGEIQLVMPLRGIAQEGTITITLDEHRLVIPVLPADNPIEVSVEPESIASGTVDPVIYVVASEAFGPEAARSIKVDLGTTGLTKASIEAADRTRLAVHLRGIAQEGTITIWLDSGAFLKESNETFKLNVQVLPSRMHTYMVIFIANNGIDQAAHASVEAETVYALPECMFDAPKGQKFAAWSIHGEEYLPGEPYTFVEDTVVEAVWDVIQADHTDDVDYEKRIRDAVGLVEQYVDKMTDEEKADPTAIDLATLYAEAVAADAITMTVGKGTIHVNNTSVSDLAELADEAIKEVEDALVRGGVSPHRILSATVTLDTQETAVEIQISPDLLESGADKIRVQTSDYALTFKAADLEADLTGSLTFKATSTDIGTLAAVSAVDIEIPGGSTTNPITVSFPTDSGKDETYQAVVSSTGTAVASKYNPATKKIEGKVNTSGTYAEKTNEVNFTDIANKSAEMQKAIKYLAARGIINGTGGTNFSPDGSISRAELTALVVRALGKVDNKATTNFTDVTTANWFYATVASSQKLGYINGFEDNTFRGNITINKEQIVVISARVLSTEMNYKTPSNTATYLGKYSDTVASWAQPQVALATRENLVVYRTDGTFSGAKDMTRGDAAIIIYRLFQRLW